MHTHANTHTHTNANMRMHTHIHVINKYILVKKLHNLEQDIKTHKSKGDIRRPKLKVDLNVAFFVHLFKTPYIDKPP